MLFITWHSALRPCPPLDHRVLARWPLEARGTAALLFHSTHHANITWPASQARRLLHVRSRFDDRVTPDKSSREDRCHSLPPPSHYPCRKRFVSCSLPLIPHPAQAVLASGAAAWTRRRQYTSRRHVCLLWPLLLELLLCITLVRWALGCIMVREMRMALARLISHTRLKLLFLLPSLFVQLYASTIAL